MSEENCFQKCFELLSCKRNLQIDDKTLNQKINHTAKIYSLTTSLVQQNRCSLDFGTSIGSRPPYAVLCTAFFDVQNFQFE